MNTESVPHSVVIYPHVSNPGFQFKLLYLLEVRLAYDNHHLQHFYAVFSHLQITTRLVLPQAHMWRRC